MFDSYTSAGKLYKKVVVGFILVTGLATAFFYSYLTEQNARRSSAAIGDFVSINFDPAATTMELGQEYTTVFKFEGSNRDISARGYDFVATFNNSLIEVTHINTLFGKEDTNSDTDKSLDSVNETGIIVLSASIIGNPEVLAPGRDLVSVTYKINSATPIGSTPNFKTVVNVNGVINEEVGDGPTTPLEINPTFFTLLTGVVSPVPTGPVPTQPVNQCGRFQDVEPGSTFYSYIQCLGCNGTVQGYACESPDAPDQTIGICVPPENLPYFLPGNFMTRGQMAKVVVSNDKVIRQGEPTGQTFADVPIGSTFYRYIEFAFQSGYVNGYPCSPDPLSPEHCDAQNRPFFRPNEDVTRGQAVKMSIIARNLGSDNVPTVNTFADVPVGSTFFPYVEEAFRLGVINGYPCSPDPLSPEHCDAQNRPFFRPNERLTRGQGSKIVAVSLNCTLSPTPGAGSPTPGFGTPTPTLPPATGNTPINLNLKFQGITAQPAGNPAMRVNVKIVSASNGKSFARQVDFKSDASGNWIGSTAIDLDPTTDPPSTRYSVYVKGPKHLKKRICVSVPTESVPGTYSCAGDRIQLTPGETNLIDARGIYQLAGDLPVNNGLQNGLIDSSDTSYIRIHFGESDPAVLQIADLNLDGAVTTQDFSLVISALGVKYDDPEDDASPIAN